MAEIVNLRTARKRLKRTEKEKEAADNRVKFGRSKNEKTQTSRQNTLDQAKHSAHVRDKEE